MDGNLFDDPGDCGDGTLCSGDNQVHNAANGQPIPFTDNVYGSIDKTSQNADSEGITLQATDKAKLFDHENQFVIGTSYDHGFVAYTADSELGFMEPKFVVAGQGVILSGTDDFNPRSLNTINDYYGYLLHRYVGYHGPTRIDGRRAIQLCAHSDRKYGRVPKTTR